MENNYCDLLLPYLLVIDSYSLKTITKFLAQMDLYKHYIDLDQTAYQGSGCTLYAVLSAQLRGITQLPDPI